MSASRLQAVCLRRCWVIMGIEALTNHWYLMSWEWEQASPIILHIYFAFYCISVSDNHPHCYLSIFLGHPQCGCKNTSLFTAAWKLYWFNLMSLRIQSQNAFIVNYFSAELATFEYVSLNICVCVCVWRQLAFRKETTIVARGGYCEIAPILWLSWWHWIAGQLSVIERRPSLASSNKSPTSKTGWRTRTHRMELAHWSHSQSVFPFLLPHLVCLFIFQSHAYLSLY